VTTETSIRTFARAVLAIFYAGAGIAHLLWPAPFLLIMPEIVPYPYAVVVVTGVLELAGAIGLLLRRWQRMAGLMLAIYAVCVLPANIRHAFSGLDIAGWPPGWWYHGPRLALQPVLVCWALWVGGWFGFAAKKADIRAVPH
jgi:uncharacterized membrane protein